MQYVPFLKDAGFQVSVLSFYDSVYLNDLYAGHRDKLRMFKFYLNRLRQCQSARQSDVIWIEKEAFPWLPWALEKRALPNVPVVLDIDDAIFHRYDHSRYQVVKSCLRAKIDRCMENASVVTAGNSYLATRASRAGARRVEVIPTVIDAHRYQSRQWQIADESFKVGWIGTPQTWAKYVRPLMPLFNELSSSHKFIFEFVGAKLNPQHEGNFNYIPWSELTEVEALKAFDVGIMPLIDEPWERGKCGYKLVQYMACGLPVVASPVGVNCALVSHGSSGFLAKSTAEWRAALITLARDKSLCRKMGGVGREAVVKNYSLQAQAKRVAAVFSGIVSPGALR